MGLYSGRGMSEYEKLLFDARGNRSVGVNHHLRRPQPSDSRLGFAGKKPKKSTILLVERALRPVKDKPELAKAYANIKARADQIRPLRKGKDNESEPENAKLQRELKRLQEENSKLRQTVAQEPVKPVSVKAEAPTPPKLNVAQEVVEVVSEPTLTHERLEELRNKIRQAAIDKVAQDLKVEHYSEYWRKLKPGFSVG